MNYLLKHNLCFLPIISFIVDEFKIINGELYDIVNAFVIVLNVILNPNGNTFKNVVINVCAL